MKAIGASALLVLIALMTILAQNMKPTGSSNIDEGKTLFETAGCAACHSSSAKSSSEVGLSITPPPMRLTEFINFVRHPSKTMRAFSKEEVSDAQLSDIYAYLQSLYPPFKNSGDSLDSLRANSETGKQLFIRDGCYECHGIWGQGANGFGPRIAPNPISMEGILNYIRKPSGNMPPYTAKIVSNQDVADIYAYLKSIPGPTNIRNVPLFTK